jgi:hypothetical protein
MRGWKEPNSWNISWETLASYVSISEVKKPKKKKKWGVG